MKINKVFGKSQIAVTAMVVALAVAIFLNMKYSDTSTKYLGEASYVSNTSSANTVETSAKAEENYFDKARADRKKTQTEIEESVTETLKSENLTEEEKGEAVSRVAMLADRMEKESNIEALIIAKGFEDCVCIISDEGISAIVKSEGLTSAQTLQIQDIITSQTEIALANIKIITVK